MAAAAPPSMFDECLLPAFRGLSLPWALGTLETVCRAWRALIDAHPDLWAHAAAPRGGGALPFGVPRLLLRAGPRLRSLDLSRVGRGAGPLPELARGLAACPGLEGLNVAGLEELSLAACPETCPSLARSLVHLNLRGCDVLHQELPELLGPSLVRLEAGWLSESDSGRDDAAWARVFPRALFREICGRCPGLRVLRVPGYALLMTPSAQGALSSWRRLLVESAADYALIEGVAALRQLRRLDLCCAQALGDEAVVNIAAGCKSLRSIVLRCCECLKDRSLLAIAEELGGSLVHINVSCCRFTGGAVRRLIERCRGLKTLDLCYCRGLDSGVVRFLCGDPGLCPGLRMLGAGGLDLGDEEVSQLCTKYQHTLEHLGIGSASRVTDRGLRALAGLPHLRRLSAHRLSAISAAGVITFCDRAPSLAALDLNESDFIPAPSEEDKAALAQRLEHLAYSYDEESGDSEDELP